MVAFPDVQTLDINGPVEVFGRTARYLVEVGRRPDLAYRVEVAAQHAGTFRTSSGTRLVATVALRDLKYRIDTLLVAGGPGARRASENPALRDWLRRMATRVRRLGSVCTGTFILAAAGLLDGRRATTHWASADELAREYPRITVDPDPIFIRDDNFYTSAGVTAGMDLALAMVEEDFGRQIALQVARHLVLFLRRPGSQSQFSAHLSVQIADREPIRDVQRWAVEHLASDLSVTVLAERAAMSPRHFARVFVQEVGLTPARYIESVRVEAARRRLEESRDGVDAISRTCGFGSAEAMRRAFLRTLKIAPTAYRRRFSCLKAS